MSIATKTGDTGTTGLLYNRRVAKNHPRVEAYGTVDELTSAIGLARATSPHPFVGDHLLAIQNDLIILMGELATLPDDLERYQRDGFHVVTPELTAKLDALVKTIESQGLHFKGWSIPGYSQDTAVLDLARSIARRAERRVCDLADTDTLRNPEIIIFLNRLSDTLWLLARWVEQKASTAANPNP